VQQQSLSVCKLRAALGHKLSHMHIWSRACVPHRWLPSTIWRRPTPTLV